MATALSLAFFGTATTVHAQDRTLPLASVRVAFACEGQPGLYMTIFGGVGAGIGAGIGAGTGAIVGALRH